MNEISSRSHTALLVKISRKILNVADEKEDFKGGNTTINSVLYLVDLAGSERVKKSKVSGERLDEAISINSSLSVLGEVLLKGINYKLKFSR